MSMRKLTALFLALLLVLSFAVPVAAEEEKSEDIVILYTNDVHTYIDGTLGYDAVAALKKDLQAQYKTVILVDAGDHAQGTAFGSMDKGKSIIGLMNAAGYDLATLGNHEFDYGMTGCINLRSWASFPYVSCNFYNESAGVRG
ncbi:MAG: metallophosphoesterase, partial [Clostridia bacterium]|nr:metallophosphoesterase [Clostridia bacterium]